MIYIVPYDMLRFFLRKRDTVHVWLNIIRENFLQYILKGKKE